MLRKTSKNPNLEGGEQHGFSSKLLGLIFMMFDLELTFCSYCAADRAGVLKPVLHARDISPKQRAGRGAGRGGTAGGVYKYIYTE